MRILFALIITYCCGYVANENLNDECEDLGNLGNSISPNITVEIGSKRNSWYNDRRRTRRYVEKLQLRDRPNARKILSTRSHRRIVAGHRARGHKPRITSSVYRVPRARRKTKDETEDESDNEKHEKHIGSNDWGKWGDWTACTVTCGNGRQVRWRHCTSKNCPTQGLKRAQMKSCHCKDCPPKGMFSWLGI